MSSTTWAGEKARIAFPSALAWRGSCSPTSSTPNAESGRKTWCTTTTLDPCITPTLTAALERAASLSA